MIRVVRLFFHVMVPLTFQKQSKAMLVNPWNNMRSKKLKLKMK